MDLIVVSVLYLTKWIEHIISLFILSIYNLYFYFVFLFFVIYNNTPRKIKVVDVLPGNNTETAIDDTVQQLEIDTDQPVEPIKEVIEKQLKQLI